MSRRCYLFALEVVPLTVGQVYDELPLHSTLMHRFWVSLSPEGLADKTKALFEQTQPLVLAVHERAKLGPKQVSVALITHSPELESLNMRLYGLLDELGVEYAAPQWVGPGHVFHVTDRPNAKLGVGESVICRAVYLIEVKVPGHDHARVPRTKIILGQRG